MLPSNLEEVERQHAGVQTYRTRQQVFDVQKVVRSNGVNSATTNVVLVESTTVCN